ncbi:MAG TPA: hypothetical protein VFV27_02595 [Nevskiaceae bacterium]|nr:hypothetical protein [Nevskiaceae bacterium]
MRLIAPSCLALLLGATLGAPSAAARSLPGADTQTLPYVHVPFLGSRHTVVQGRALRGGGCSFPVNLRLAPGQVAPGQQYLRVTRAINRVTCQELLEEGLVLAEFSPVSLPLPTPQSTQESVTLQSPESRQPDQSGHWSARSLVRYTQINHPLTQVLRPTVEGVPVSLLDSVVGHTLDGSCTGGTYALYSSSTTTPHHLIPTGWTRSDYRIGHTNSCDHTEHFAYVRHDNSSNLGPLMDCSQGGVRIEYNPLTLRVDRFGGFRLGGRIGVRGDLSNCGEHLVRFDTVFPGPLDNFRPTSPVGPIDLPPPL